MSLIPDEEEKRKVIDKYRPLIAKTLGIPESEVFPKTKTIKEWADEDNIDILTFDGFGKPTMALFAKKYRNSEYKQCLEKCEYKPKEEVQCVTY